MLRLFAPILLISAIGWGCSSECTLEGSECDLRSCDYNHLECDSYPQMGTTPRAIVVHYLTVEDAGRQWTARMSLEFPGTDKIEGQVIVPPDLQERVIISEGAGGWPTVVDGKCEIKEGGDEVGKPLKGKCGFKFDNGRFLTACFECTLEEALPP